MTDSGIREVVIIGSGPAGYTAALYTARAQLKPLLFGSSIFVGGSLTTTTEVENFPGFPGGVDGPALMENMRAHDEKFGAEMVDDDIVEVDLTGDIKLLTDSSGTVHRAKTVIVATGSGYRRLGLDKEEALSGRGVCWCATWDGFFFRDRDIVVVGGGDTAMEEATFLTRFAKSVTIVHRRSTLRASQVMQNRAFADDKISFAFDSEIAELREENGMLAGRPEAVRLSSGRSLQFEGDQAPSRDGRPGLAEDAMPAHPGPRNRHDGLLTRTAPMLTRW
ncbi:NAD(P)/FAD-dependent oxidoreductase [Streptomyces sp. NPDC056390]|uniref:NAD(P)/FAD-dependent oxidoreductase n=1 Tax=Streptomyces sp. NPDC056390 TaxID=3345806 RepID=UPI0035DC0475